MRDAEPVLVLSIHIPFVGPVVALAVSAMGVGAIALSLLATLKYTRTEYDPSQGALA